MLKVEESKGKRRLFIVIVLALHHEVKKNKNSNTYYKIKYYWFNIMSMF
jgi:hypothetical protein